MLLGDRKGNIWWFCDVHAQEALVMVDGAYVVGTVKDLE